MAILCYPSAASPSLSAHSVGRSVFWFPLCSTGESKDNIMSCHEVNYFHSKKIIPYSKIMSSLVFDVKTPSFWEKMMTTDGGCILLLLFLCSRI